MEQAVRRAALDRLGAALVAAHHHLAVHHLGDGLEAGPHRLAHGAEPRAVVDDLGEVERDALAVVEGLAVEHELLEATERFHEDGAARGLVDAAALHAHEAVLADVDAADAVAGADGVELGEERHRVEGLAVDGGGVALAEGDGHVLVGVGRVLRAGGDHPHVFRRGVPRILELAALMADVPDVGVAAVDLLGAGRGGHVARLEVGEHGLAALEVPDAPRADHAQLRGERGVGALEADLVVALAGAAVAERVAAGGECHLDLRAGDDRAGDGGAHQVAVLVDRAGDRHREGELAQEGLLEVDDDALGRAALGGLLADALELALALADVGHAGDHFAAVGFLEPRDDAGGVEAAGVGDADLLGGGVLGGGVGVGAHGGASCVGFGVGCSFVAGLGADVSGRQRQWPCPSRWVAWWRGGGRAGRSARACGSRPGRRPPSWRSRSPRR